MFEYQVLSSGVIDTIYAANLKEAKKIAASKRYKTAYYKVARVYERGIRASSGITNLH